jgi:hypothetical protein
MKFRIVLAVTALWSAPALAERLEHIGSADNGAELYVDRDSMRSTPPDPQLRPFPATQIWAIYDLQGVRRDPGRSERALYSFDCVRRTSNILEYKKFKANGARIYDWKAADLDFKYDAVKPGSLTEYAMIFVCNGGKMPEPVVQQDMGGLVRVDDEMDEPEGVAPPPKRP